MPLSTIRAFVLADTTIHEQDKLVSLLSEDGEIMKALAPGALKNRNRFGALFELFNEGDFHFYWQENRELIVISKGESIHSNFDLISSSRNLFYFYFMAEILLKFVPHNQKESRIFRLVKAVLAASEKGIEIRRLLGYFMIWILRIEGMMFDPCICQNCGQTCKGKVWVKNDFRGILCLRCRTDERCILNELEVDFLEKCRQNPPDDSKMQAIEVDLPKILRFLKGKIEYHGELTLKSGYYIDEFK